MLIVRGGPDKFGFVCGNTSPFEMATVKLHIRLPIFVMRQLIRHRTASVNEQSGRYMELGRWMSATAPTAWRLQSKANKQGSDGCLDEEIGAPLSKQEADFHEMAWDVYQTRLKLGVAREQARKDLPLSLYTECYWKMDLHNLLHFLRLRMAPDAQEEIREYANVIGAEIVARWCPTTWGEFVAARTVGV